jgi:hypothetical protein
MKKIVFIALLLSSTAVAQNDPNNFHLDKEFEINPTGVIKLYASDAKVQINGSSREKAHVKIDRQVTIKGWFFGNESFGIDVNEEDGNLTIREKRQSVSGIIGFYSEKYTIVLELPSSASIAVHGDDGDYKVKNINGVISFDLDDADVELTDCGGSDFSFKMDDGDVTMNHGKGKLQLDGDDADVKIANGSFESIEATIDDGDLVIETSLVEEGKYYIKAEDGLVLLTVLKGGGKFDVRHEDGRIVVEGKFELLQENENHKQFGLAQGTARVEIRADDAKVKLIGR